MKRLLSLLLVCSLVLSSAAATGGDPNIEGGGGGVGEGGVVGDSAWNPGDDGVRVSVMRGNTAVATFDISNILRTRTQWCYQKTLHVSMAVAAIGAVIGLVMRNPLLAIVLAVGFYFIPLWWTQFSLYRYDQLLNDELETALSLITTSYSRNNDILAAVEENLSNIREPVKGVFTSFVNALRYVDANAPAQIERIKGMLDNPIWRQWCDSLILCQADHTMRDALVPIVAKFSDQKAQQEANATKMMLPLQRAGGMIGLTLGIIPLLYLCNKQWYVNLVSTLFGQVALVLTAIAVLVTINAAIKLSKPIQYNV